MFLRPHSAMTAPDTLTAFPPPPAHCPQPFQHLDCRSPAEKDAWGLWAYLGIFHPPWDLCHRRTSWTMSAACQEEQGGSFHPLELMSYRKTSMPFQPYFNCPQALKSERVLPALPLSDTVVATAQALGTLQGLSHLGFPSLLT